MKNLRLEANINKYSPIRTIIPSDDISLVWIISACYIILQAKMNELHILYYNIKPLIKKRAK